MPQVVLGPLLRYVSTTSATIWVEVDQPCRVEVCGAEASTFTYAGHHFALVVVRDLPAGSCTRYEVRLDGAKAWPAAGTRLPPPVIRTLDEAHQRTTVVFGSCRAADPDAHTSAAGDGRRPRDVDALRALGLRMLAQDPADWPALLVLLGDQVYADGPSPRAAARMADRPRTTGAPDGVVADFEEYSWLYCDAWEPEIERWVLSVLPTTMIFDDHDMIDDWNISAAWVGAMRSEPWWGEHVIGGLVSYWIYQHLGNLSPDAIDAEGMLRAAVEAGDATALLRRWALESENLTPVPGGYQFSFDRHLGAVHLVVIDARNGRVLEPGQRQMLDDVEWSWVRERAAEPARHLVLATSLPVFVPGGLHGLQQWNEAWCDAGPGRSARRFSEWLRRALDLEDWPAFDRTFRAFEALLVDVATPTASHRPPSTISLLSGDIHFAYIAAIDLPAGSVSAAYQVVCSPLRNSLRSVDRHVLRLGVSRVGRWMGRQLASLAHRPASLVTWELCAPPVFGNNIGTLRFDSEELEITIEVASLDGDCAHLLRAESLSASAAGATRAAGAR